MLYRYFDSYLKCMTYCGMAVKIFTFGEFDGPCAKIDIHASL